MFRCAHADAVKQLQLWKHCPSKQLTLHTMLVELATIMDEPFFACAATFVVHAAAKVVTRTSPFTIQLDLDKFGSPGFFDSIDVDCGDYRVRGLGPSSDRIPPYPACLSAPLLAPTIPAPPATISDLKRAVAYMAGLGSGFRAAFVLQHFAAASVAAVDLLHGRMHADLKMHGESERVVHFFARAHARGYDMWNTCVWGCALNVDDNGEEEDGDGENGDEPRDQYMKGVTLAVLAALKEVAWTNYEAQGACLEFACGKRARAYLHAPDLAHGLRTVLSRNLAVLDGHQAPPDQFLLYACAYCLANLLVLGDYSLCKAFERVCAELLVTAPLCNLSDSGSLPRSDWTSVLDTCFDVLTPRAKDMVAEFPALVEALLVLYLQVSVMHWHDLHDNVAWFQTSVMQHWAGTGTVWATRGWLADTALCWLATCYCVEPRNPGLPSVTVRANPGTALLVQDICQCIVHPQDVMKLFRSLELQSQWPGDAPPALTTLHSP